MKYSVSVIAEIFNLEPNELRPLIEASPGKYGFSLENGELKTTEPYITLLIRDFANTHTIECGICKQPVGRSLKNLNLADGFRDAALNIFVCWNCCNNEKYTKLKELDKTINH